MDGGFARWIGPAIVLLCMGGLMGCQSSGLATENQRLTQENQELQKSLERERGANAALQARLNQPGPVVQVGDSSGFSKIEGVETIRGKGKITVRIPGDILFPSGQAALKESAKRTLDQIAAVIKSDYAENTIRVEGYTDSDPIRRSAWTDNLQLSMERAAAVHRYLQSQGVSEDQMYAAGFGPGRPQATKEKSRRVEIVVVLNE